MIAALLMFGLSAMLYLSSDDRPLTARDLAMAFWLIGLAFFIQASPKLRKRKP